MQALFVYVTTSDRAEAERIAAAAIEERLAACANVVDGAQSLYWWQGKTERSAETLLIMKTMEDRMDALSARVASLHGYDCPCVAAMPIVAGNPDYLAWIEAETRPGPRDAG